MTNDQNTTRPLLSASEVELLGRAAALLQRLEERASRHAWGKPSAAPGQRPKAQDLGRLSAHAYRASDAVFDTVNVLENYCATPGVIALFNEAGASWDHRNPRDRDELLVGDGFYGHSVKV